MLGFLLSRNGILTGIPSIVAWISLNGELFTDTGVDYSRYLVDSGAQDTNILSTTGKGVTLDGVDQSIPIPLPAGGGDTWDVGIERDWDIDDWLASDLLDVDPRVTINTSGAQDVTDMGANSMVGDGATDNSVNFQYALDNYDKVYIPAGASYFKLEDTTTINSRNTLIYGDGELYGTDYYGILVTGSTTLSGSLTIDGLTFNSHPVAGTHSASITMSSSQNNVNTTIQNCTFKGSLTRAINHFTCHVFDNTQKVDNLRLINNEFINCGRMGAEITDRNENPDVPNSSVVDTQILYNRFHFDTEAGQTIDGSGNHFFVSLASDRGEEHHMVGSVFTGNYIENCEWALEVSGLVDIEYTYNSLVQVKTPYGDGVEPENFRLRYNYIEMPDGVLWVADGADVTFEYNQIIGEIRFEDTTGMDFGFNKCYNTDSNKPLHFQGGSLLHMYNNYFDGTDCTGSAFVYIDGDGDNSFGASTVIEDNRVYSNVSIPVVVAYNTAAPTLTNNVEVFVQEAPVQSGDASYIYKYEQTNGLEEEYVSLSTYELGTVDGEGITPLSGTWSNFIATLIPFTTTQKEYLEEYPETFLYMDSGSLASDILNQAEIDNIGAYLPLCESDDVAIDILNYSESAEMIAFPFENWTVQNDGGDSSITEDGDNYIVIDYVATDNTWLNMFQNGIHTVAGLYLLEITIESITGTIKVQDDTYSSYGNISTAGTHYLIGYQDDPSVYVGRYDVNEDVNAVISNISIKLLDGAFSIANFDENVRENDLSKGIQSIGLTLDHLGVPTGLADTMAFDVNQEEQIVAVLEGYSPPPTLGDEMMTNWDFGDGTVDPWTGSNATLANDAFRMKITRNSSTAYATTSIDEGVTEDATHRIAFDVEIGTADRVYLYTAQSGFEANITEDGHYEYDVILRNYNVIRVNIGNVDTQYAYVDNFSVKEVL